jgi:hypothetical protein
LRRGLGAEKGAAEAVIEEVVAVVVVLLYDCNGFACLSVLACLQKGKKSPQQTECQQHQEEKIIAAVSWGALSLGLEEIPSSSLPLSLYPQREREREKERDACCGESGLTPFVSTLWRLISADHAAGRASDWPYRFDGP